MPGDTPDEMTVPTTRTVDIGIGDTRMEHDLLGEAAVPNSAYWGVHTMRAVQNFPITGVPVGHFHELVRALALVKLGRRALAESRSVADVVLDEGLLTEGQLSELMRVEAMTHPSRVQPEAKR